MIIITAGKYNHQYGFVILLAPQHQKDRKSFVGVKVTVCVHDHESQCVNCG